MPLHFTDFLGPEVVLPPPTADQSAEVPLGLDNGHLAARAMPVTLSSVTSASLTSAFCKVLPTGHIQITDKIAFYAALPEVLSVTLNGPEGSEIIDLELEEAPGYYDIELLQANMSVHFDTGHNLGIATDSIGDAIAEVLDRGNLGMHGTNRWYHASGRPTRAPSVFNADRKCMKSVPPVNPGSTYGAAFFTFKGTDLPNSKWRGLRFWRFDSADNKIQITPTTAEGNTPLRLTMPGSLVGSQTTLMLIGWDATGVVWVRKNGVEVLRTAAGAWVPPENPGLIAYVFNFATANVTKTACFISHTAFAQHPWWETGTPDGDVCECVEFLNIAGHM